jgi:hypothetical protein
VVGEVSVARHGTAHAGPIGRTIAATQFSAARGGVEALPVVLEPPAELEPGTDYLLSLRLQPGPGQLETLGEQSSKTEDIFFGRGLPPGRGEGQAPLRWFEVHRGEGDTQGARGQFPLIYYIA